jgi:hypothetical protein
MATPGFAAERALDPARRMYRSPRSGGRPVHSDSVVPQDSGVGAVRGVYIGTTCWNHETTEVYVDYGPDGISVTGIHPVAVGSC